VFLIAGSGRSGTSAVARLLHISGITVGRHLIEPDANNAEGYFEERPVVELNERILARAGLHDWFSVATRGELLDAATPFHDDMCALLADAAPAWKDPRFSWTLEAWLQLMAAPPRVIVCLRSPAEVVASTTRYYGLAGDDAERAVVHLWRVQYERLLEVIDAYALDALSVEYAALQAGERDSVARLERFVGRPLDAAAVRADLRHHVAPVPDALRALYERVRSLGRVREGSPAAPRDASP
jgi:hypothetical protein